MSSEHLGGLPRHRAGQSVGQADNQQRDNPENGRAVRDEKKNNHDTRGDQEKSEVCAGEHVRDVNRKTFRAREVKVDTTQASFGRIANLGVALFLDLDDEGFVERDNCRGGRAVIRDERGNRKLNVGVVGENLGDVLVDRRDFALGQFGRFGVHEEYRCAGRIGEFRNDSSNFGRFRCGRCAALGSDLCTRRCRQEEHRAGDGGRHDHRNQGGPESVSFVQEHGEISVLFRHPRGDHVVLAYRIVRR